MYILFGHRLRIIPVEPELASKVCLRFGNKILSLEGVDKHFMKLMIKFAW